ncbi:hypothetical protein OE88DRAFT_1731221 [Heliocybe sulcata]|uniref:F-box domain-containing protein n=1 Tax=Heliocybe sulcata TaxID=5364 RepID=A0A5C3NDZ6_9AGAM|nr:hypothetical protein OE88DRAFT_1731221 [Heliocybe sulcata]
MARIHRRCTRLEELEMDNCSSSPEVLRGVYEFVPSFEHMRRLDYVQTAWDTTMFHLLAELPGLEDLRFEVRGRSGADMPTIGPQPQQHNGRWFRSLQTLSVQVSKLSFIQLLLSMVKSAPLEKLSLFIFFRLASGNRLPNEYLALQSLRVMKLSMRLDIASTLLAHMNLPRLEEVSVKCRVRPDLLSDLIGTVCTSCSPSWLKLVLLGRGSIREARGSPILIDSVLRPLLAFRRIEDLRLISSHTLEISDKTVEDFGLSWPGLKEISLGMGSRRSASSVILKGIASLALHCPRLELIALPVNVTPVPTIEELEYKDTPLNSNVRELGFGSPSIPAECVGEVASVLRQIFPALQIIRSSEGPTGVHQSNIQV